MTNLLATRLKKLATHHAAELFTDSKIGVEKECLRVTGNGTIALTSHPDVLGSALENRYITTDYSEALLEFVTPPVLSPWEAIQFLCDLHQFTHASIGDEILWPLSMPCRIEADDDVPIAQYGSSNVGRMKTIYRKGLGYRYGRRMQAIAGIHFNFSPPEPFWNSLAEVDGVAQDSSHFRSSAYMALVRNVRRHGWLLSYLFGASPAIAMPFPVSNGGVLQALDSETLYGPYSTSLRMSDIGYQNSNQATISVSANSIEQYIEDLSQAVHTPCADYERFGVLDGDDYKQLNSNLLQIENEFYGTIRPKRVARRGEKPTNALRRGGVEYIELRSLDISPFDPVGINQQQIRFLEAFLYYCLLTESPPIDAAEKEVNERSQAIVAAEGRRPGLQLPGADGEQLLTDRAQSVCAGVLEVARAIDGGQAGASSAAVEAQLRVVQDSSLTPSARLLADLEETGQSLLEYGLSIGNKFSDYFSALDPKLNVRWDSLEEESRASLQRQADIEVSDTLSFAEYVERYNA